MPDNVTEMTAKVAEISGFQVIPTDEADEQIYGHSKDEFEPFSYEFERVGHETCVNVMNVGAPQYIVVFVLLGMILKHSLSCFPRI